MIKLVSLFVFTFAFVASWALINCKNTLSLETHAGIQSKFISLIEETVKKARPNVTNFEIVSMYTKIVDANQLSAHFTYKFTDNLENKDSVNQLIEGEAILNRGLSEDPTKENWIVRSVKANNSAIDFVQGLTVQPDPNGTMSEATPNATANSSATEIVAPASSDETSLKK